MPAPSAELVLVRVMIESIIDVAGKKKGERLLTAMAERLSHEERLCAVLKIRPATDDAAVRRARGDAMVWYRQCLPIFMARL